MLRFDRKKFCKAITLQLKNKLIRKKVVSELILKVHFSRVGREKGQ